MSKLSNNKKYLNLDNVRVSYQYKEDSIHLTSDDKDLRNKPFKLTLNKGTESYEILKNLLLEKGLTKTEDDTNSIPTNVRGVIDSRSSWREMPIGVSADESIYWSIKDHANLIVDSPTVGCGVKSVRNSILSHCISHNNKWEVYLHDYTKGDLKEFTKYSNTVKRFSNSSAELFYIVSSLYNEMKMREDLMSDLRLPDVSFLTDPPKNILLLIEGYDLLISPKSANFDKADEFFRKQTLEKLEKIALLGHKSSIYISIQGVGLSNITDSNIIKHFTNSLVLGNYSNAEFKSIVGSIKVDKLESPNLGRGLFFQFTRATETQIYALPISEIDEWVLRFGSKREPELYKNLVLSSIIKGEES